MRPRLKYHVCEWGGGGGGCVRVGGVGGAGGGGGGAGGVLGGGGGGGGGNSVVCIIVLFSHLNLQPMTYSCVWCSYQDTTNLVHIHYEIFFHVFNISLFFILCVVHWMQTKAVRPYWHVGSMYSFEKNICD